MMGVRTPETRWAVNKRQDNKLEKLLHLVDLLELVRLSLSMPWMYTGAEEVWLHSFFNFSTRCRWVVICPGHFIPKKEPWYPMNRRLVGPRSWSGHSGEENTLPGYEPWNVHPKAYFQTSQQSSSKVNDTWNGKLPLIYIFTCTVRAHKCWGMTVAKRWGHLVGDCTVTISATNWFKSFYYLHVTQFQTVQSFHVYGN